MSLFKDRKQTLFMGVLNVTPDSFADGGYFFDPQAAITHAYQLATEGADIVDIGGESTREVLGIKQATPVTHEEEWSRLEPVLTALKGKLDVPISIDTYRSTTAKKAIELGATIINDVWGYRRDPDMPHVIADTGVYSIIMHNQPTNEYTQDIVHTVVRFLKESLDIAHKAGIASDKIILDPGIAFGKTLEHNFEILHRLDEIKALGFPVMVGFSRKSMLGKILDLPPSQRLEGTLATTTLAILKGADIIRVHDVQANIRAAKITEAYQHHNSQVAYG